MRMKQMTAVTSALLLGIAGQASAASDKDGQPAEPDRRSITTDSGTEIIIRSEADKQRRVEGHGNRQSDADASRGLERAEERRPEQAEIHSQAEPHASEDNEHPWYDPFGLIQQPGSGKNDNGDGSWWWPFD